MKGEYPAPALQITCRDRLTFANQLPKEYTAARTAPPLLFLSGIVEKIRHTGGRSGAALCLVDTHGQLTSIQRWHAPCCQPAGTAMNLYALSEEGLSQKAVEIGHVFGFPITNSMVVTWAVALGLILFAPAGHPSDEPGAQRRAEPVRNGSSKRSTACSRASSAHT